MRFLLLWKETVTNTKYDYEWQKFGLLITTPLGTCWLQGDEAGNLYDELEACETDEQVQLLLSEYEHVCE